MERQTHTFRNERELEKAIKRGQTFNPGDYVELERVGEVGSRKCVSLVYSAVTGDNVMLITPYISIGDSVVIRGYSTSKTIEFVHEGDNRQRLKELKSLLQEANLWPEETA